MSTLQSIMANKFEMLTQGNKYNFIYRISKYLLNADYVHTEMQYSA